MTHRTLAFLVALNVALLATLALMVFTQPEPAQAQGLGNRNNFSMIAGEVTGRDSQDLIYIIDISSGEMRSFFFNSNNDQIQAVGSTNIIQN